MNTVEPIRDKAKLEEIKSMLRARDPRDYLLFSLGLNLGLRVSDLLRLRIKDVFNSDNQVKSFLYLREKKTGKERKITLNSSAKEALEYYYSKRRINDSNEWLFKSKRSKNKSIDRVRAYRLIKKWTGEVGLSDRFGTHSLRKTFGYMARTEKHISIELLQSKFGHSSPQVTARYIGITQDEVNNLEAQVCL